MDKLRILIKGAGEMATGIAHRLFMANVGLIVMTEIAEPVTIRRTVAFSEAIYEKETKVEGVRARVVTDPGGIYETWKEGIIAVITDPEWKILTEVKPSVVVDSIMRKEYTGTSRDEAPLVIGIGPGFRAPEDVHAVIESNNGHNLGKVIYHGEAEPYHRVARSVRVNSPDSPLLRAPQEGHVRHKRLIGDVVEKDDIVLYVDDVPLRAPVSGVVRGLIREIRVRPGEKVGDIDPGGIRTHCFTISHKARALGGGVLEAITRAFNCFSLL